MNLWCRLNLLAMRRFEVERIDGIALVDLRNRGDSFQQTIHDALTLIRQHDLRRYSRVRRYIHRVVNHVQASSMAMYSFGSRACIIDFRGSLSGFDSETLSAWYACCLVHESTHGVIEARGIRYRGHRRTRIERLCVQEQNRFAERLAAAQPERYPLKLLQQSYDGRRWQESWNAGLWKKTFSFFRRCREDDRAEPSTAPNGGPAMPSGNSRATEGPPSVS